MTHRAARLTLVLCCAAVAAGAGACSARASAAGAGDLDLAIAASESLTTAIADSVVPNGVGARGSASRYDTDTLSACEDHVDASEWQIYTSSIVDLPLPPDFSAATEANGRATWRSAGGYVVASPKSSRGWTGLIVSQCEVYISGYPARLYVLNTLYGRGVHATIRIEGKQDIEIDAQTRSTRNQAEFLHALRYARVSPAYGQ